MTAEFKYQLSDPVAERHLKALHTAAFNNYNLQDVPRYLTEKTYLAGDRFSFKDHEFQLDIAMDTNRDVNVQKCAQVGLSELMARYAVAVARIMPYFSVIMTMPMSKDAAKFTKTRINPIINDSPDLRSSMDPEMDNSEIKGIGSSILYFRGTQGATQAISVPADMLIHDEVDRSDPATLGQYQSRLKHSKWKLTRKFGTPTANKVGIALAMETSLRMHHMCKCDKCNHQFVPNYHDHVIVPGYDDRKEHITKYMLGNLRWKDAKLLCPHCGREPSLLPAHREWVIQNNTDSYTAHGYYVTPFSVPNIVSIPSLVMESTRYESWSEFVNQALGETAQNDNQSLTIEDIEKARVDFPLDSVASHCMGIDVGQVCHIVIGRIDAATGMLLVVHKERVKLGELQLRRAKLMGEYRVMMTVIDSFPETNLVFQMQRADKNLYGAVYHDNKQLAVYQLAHVDDKPREGKIPIHQAKIHRNRNFDELMLLFKQGMVRWARGANDENAALFISHCLDMTRKQEFTGNNELVYVWNKSESAQDHFFHALGYLHVACRLAPTAVVHLPAGVGFSMARTTKMPSMQEALRLR